MHVRYLQVIFFSFYNDESRAQKVNQYDYKTDNGTSKPFTEMKQNFIYSGSRIIRPSLIRTIVPYTKG